LKFWRIALKGAYTFALTQPILVSAHSKNDGSMQTKVSAECLGLDFTKPFEAHNQILFTLTPEGDGTRVTWTMSGPSPFITKLFTLFFNMDKSVGADFERGLAKLAATTKR
jgi:hypothetical protein